MDANNQTSCSISLGELRRYFGGNVPPQERLIVGLRLCGLSERDGNLSEEECANLTKGLSNPMSDSNDGQPICYDPITQIAVKKEPDGSDSDKIHELAVTLFIVCFGENPYLGRKFYEEPALTNETIEELFGSTRQFIFAPEGDNYPDPHYQSTPIALWNAVFLRRVKSLLEAYFTEGRALSISELREALWSTLASLAFANSPQIQVEIEDCGLFTLSNGKKLLNPLNYTILGETYLEQKGVPELYLKNNTQAQWRVVTPSGKERSIAPNADFPLRVGMRCEIEGLALDVK